MTDNPVALAIERVKRILGRRPQTGVHDDAPATATWRNSTVVESSHANGARILTDMPEELGGGGQHVTPGWLFRAGLASCAATSIAMKAASARVELTALDVQVFSRSDTRGLLGMHDASGATVPPGPQEIQMVIHIAANGISATDLSELARSGVGCAPIAGAVQCAVPFDIKIETTAR